jgi:ATP-binding cassette subfamily B (MDR/TAP) protein 9
MLNDSFGAMGDIYASITSAIGAAEKIFSILEKAPEFATEEYPLVPASAVENVKGTIEFKNVAFSYPTRSHVQTLKGVSMTIPAGSVAALVGPSGQGKSTCLALLQRWYCQSAGDITLDHVAVRRYEHHAYHRIVSCVNQEPLLFARTVRENILFGIINPGEAVSEELEKRVVEAAKLACAHKFITAMPEGYNTQVGMRGVQLSGGQKQRIAIARALVRNPKVLLLDEATSALDSESEHQVQAALDCLIRNTAGGITTIIVAHRLSTVRNADCIYVVDKGQVVEKGKHEELVANESSAYYKLVSNQLLAAGVPRSSSTSSIGFTSDQ